MAGVRGMLAPVGRGPPWPSAHLVPELNFRARPIACMKFNGLLSLRTQRSPPPYPTKAERIVDAIYSVQSKKGGGLGWYCLRRSGHPRFQAISFVPARPG